MVISISGLPWSLRWGEIWNIDLVKDDMTGIEVYVCVKHMCEKICIWGKYIWIYSWRVHTCVWWVWVYIYWQYWRLNLGSHACKVSILPLSYIPNSKLLHFFVRGVWNWLESAYQGSRQSSKTVQWAGKKSTVTVIHKCSFNERSSSEKEITFIHKN